MSFGSGDAAGKLTGSFDADKGLAIDAEITIKSGKDTARAGIEMDMGMLGTEGGRACPDASARATE